MKSLYSIFIAAAFSFTACAQTLPEATLTVEVLDDSGAPVSGAEVRISFEAFSGKDNESSVGLTNKKGRFTASGHTTGMVFYAARKEGFYENVGLRQHFNKKDGLKWIPNDIVSSIVLKRVVEPVPMYVKQVSLEVPILNTPLGFDLEVGDWVAPYGKGIKTDFIFFVTRRWVSMEDFDSSVRLYFPKKLDGIQSFEGDTQKGSILTSPQIASEKGYDSEWKRETSANPKAGRNNWGTVRNQNFIFRVRTVEDEKGNIKEANYGKIYGDIGYGGEASEKMKIGFWYYFNPKVNSRSLEFDTTKNLFPDVRVPKP